MQRYQCKHCLSRITIHNDTWVHEDTLVSISPKPYKHFATIHRTNVVLRELRLAIREDPSTD